MSQMNLESRKKFFFDSLKEIFFVLGMTTVNKFITQLQH